MKIFNIAFKVSLVLSILAGTYVYLTINRFEYGTFANTQTRTDRLTKEVFILRFPDGFSNGGKWELLAPAP